MDLLDVVDNGQVKKRQKEIFDPDMNAGNEKLGH